MRIWQSRLLCQVSLKTQSNNPEFDETTVPLHIDARGGFRQKHQHKTTPLELPVQ